MKLSRVLREKTRAAIKSKAGSVVIAASSRGSGHPIDLLVPSHVARVLVKQVAMSFHQQLVQSCHHPPAALALFDSQPRDAFSSIAESRP